jgi:hypothetical protein
MNKRTGRRSKHHTHSHSVKPDVLKSLLPAGAPWVILGDLSSGGCIMAGLVLPVELAHSGDKDLAD